MLIIFLDFDVKALLPSSEVAWLPVIFHLFYHFWLLAAHIVNEIAIANTCSSFPSSPC